MATGCQGVTRSHTHKTLGRVHSSGWQQAGLQHREEAECEEAARLGSKASSTYFFLGSTEKLKKKTENGQEKMFWRNISKSC